MMRIRVFSVDDHPVFRKGLQNIVDSQPDLEFVGGASSGREGLRELENVEVDLVTVDMRLGDMSGLELITLVKKQFPNLYMLALSMHDEQLYAQRALRSGACGYLSKEAPTELLINGIRSAAKGQMVLSQKMQETMLRQMVTGGASGGLDPITMLSDRELEVFELTGQGLRTREIGKRLFISVKTVETHRANIKAKLGLSSSGDLLRAAITWTMGGHPTEATNSGGA